MCLKINVICQCCKKKIEHLREDIDRVPCFKRLCKVNEVRQYNSTDKCEFCKDRCSQIIECKIADYPNIYFIKKKMIKRIQHFIQVWSY
jgi:hypothetical protein